MRDGPSGTNLRSRLSRKRLATEAGSNPHHAVKATTLLAGRRPNPASPPGTESHLSIRMQAPHQLCFGLGLSVVDDRIEIDVKESDCRIDTIVRLEPAASMSTRRNQPCASPISRQESLSLPKRALAAQRTRRPPGNMLRAPSMSRNGEAGKRRPMQWKQAKPISAGATRFAPMCLQPYQLVKDLRPARAQERRARSRWRTRYFMKRPAQKLSAGTDGIRRCGWGRARVVSC